MLRIANRGAGPEGRGPGRFELTRGPIAVTLLWFALPILAANILQSLNGTINAIWVARLLGEGALAAASNANLIVFRMFALSFGIGLAVAILTGQAKGRGDLDQIKRTVGAAVSLFAAGSLVMATLGWLFAPQLLEGLDLPAELKSQAVIYLRTSLIALPAMMISLPITMALRSVGDSKVPLGFMLLNVTLDAGLNPFLILGFGPIPPLGIEGSAFATVIANYVALGAMLIAIYAGRSDVRLRPSEFKFLLPPGAMLRNIRAIGLPLVVQQLVMSAASVLIMKLVNRQGVTITAAFGVTQQLWTYAQMPALAISAAVSVMAAQNIGQGRWDRVGQITRTGAAINTAMTAAAVIALLQFDALFLSLFVAANSPVVPVAEQILLFASWSYIPFGVALVLFSTMRANGAVGVPLGILFVGMVVRVAFAWMLARPFGNEMLWLAFPVSSVVILALAAAAYRFGRWRKGGIAARTAEYPSSAENADPPA